MTFVFFYFISWYVVGWHKKLWTVVFRFGKKIVYSITKNVNNLEFYLDLKKKKKLPLNFMFKNKICETGSKMGATQQTELKNY